MILFSLTDGLIHSLKPRVLWPFVLAATLVAAPTVQSAEPAVKAPEPYAQAGKITYCAPFGNPPFQYQEDGKPKGVTVELGERAAELMKLDIVWAQTKFPSLIPTLLAKQCDVIIEELYVNPDRQKIINMVPYGKSADQIFVPIDSTQPIESLTDLSGLKVATVTGGTFHHLALAENERLKAAGKPEIDIIATENTPLAFNDVLAGLSDAGGATTASVAYYNLKAAVKVKPVGAPFHESLDAFGVRKDEPQLADAFAEALKIMRSDGTYDDIFAKYNMQAAILKE